MFEYLKRLGRTGAAYATSSVVAKLFAVALLPLYTHYLSRADYGAAEVLLAGVVMTSIFVRLGIIEALLRFYYRFDAAADRERAVRTSFTWLLITTTVGAAIAVPFAGLLSELLLAERNATLVLVAIGGLWIFTNYELLLALFRLDERARAYLITSSINVLLTIGLTVWLVVGLHEGAEGLLLGNFGASAVVYFGLLLFQRKRLGIELAPKLLQPMLRFGVPTMPAEISIFSLNFVDRFLLVRFSGLGQAGLYSIAVKFSQVVIVVVRAFQLAWPPLAYSIREDSEARRAYAMIVTYYLFVCTWIVVGLALLARWLLRLLVADQFFAAWKAIPFVATGAMLYGLYLVLIVIIGRVGRTEFNFPVVGSAMLVNIGLNLVLIPPFGIVGAGLSLVGSYLCMLVALYFIGRRFFVVPFQWLRLLRIAVVGAGLVALGELLLPASDTSGLISRAALLGAYPVLLFLSGFFSHAELNWFKGFVGRSRSSGQ